MLCSNERRDEEGSRKTECYLFSGVDLDRIYEFNQTLDVYLADSFVLQDGYHCEKIIMS